jgi:uncharacterized membrane protein
MRQSLVIIPLIHILTYLGIGLDLPIFRQVVVFIYLTFVPGFILLRFLRLKETKTVDTILFSVGLSVAFLMFVGFVINELFLALGVPMPLSTIPLEITLSFLTLFLFYVGYRRDLFGGFSSLNGNIAVSIEAVLKSTILFLPAFLGILGALYVSVSSLSILLLSFMVIVIATVFVVSNFSLRLIPSKFHPLMIFAISTALALHILLISKYIIGYDAQLEYQIFKLTINRGSWTLLPVGIDLVGALNYNSMLSVTVLPSVYSALLNVDGEVLFKTLYPFVFALVPVVLYRVYEQQMGKASSLLSTLFLISSPLGFYGVGLLSTNRQIVAMFFLVLSILILLDKMTAVGKRKILFAVFGAALIMSHYSTAYLYLGLIFFTYAISRIRGRNNGVLNGPMILLLSGVTFAWYGLTGTPLKSLTDFFYQLYSRFAQDIVSTTARDATVFASHSVLTFASAVNWVLFVIVHSMIFVGILVAIFNSEKAKLDPTYRTLLIMSSVVLFLSLAVPNVAPALDFSRFYQLSLLFLAPCFVLGGLAFVYGFTNLLRRATRSNFLVNAHKIGTVLLCGVLFGYFLSQSGFVNCVTEAAPLSYSLDFSRFITSRDLHFRASFYSAYISEQNFFSAVWLSNHAAMVSTVYADYDSRQSVLFSHGSVFTKYLPLRNSTVPAWDSFVYLSGLNIGGGVITDRDSVLDLFNSSEISPFLSQSDLIYSNGNGEIWYVPSPG